VNTATGAACKQYSINFSPEELVEGFYSTWGGSKQPDLSDYTKCTSRATMTSNQSNKLSSSLEVLNYRRRLMKKSPSTQLKKRGRKPKAGTSAKKQQKCL
jgi:hypothetical protein